VRAASDDARWPEMAKSGFLSPVRLPFRHHVHHSLGDGGSGPPKIICPAKTHPVHRSLGEGGRTPEFTTTKSAKNAKKIELEAGQPFLPASCGSAILLEHRALAVLPPHCVLHDRPSKSKLSKWAFKRSKRRSYASAWRRGSRFFLLPSDFSEIAACLHSWNDDAWDDQMKSDLASSKLDKMLAQVNADIAQNKIRALLASLLLAEKAETSG